MQPPPSDSTRRRRSPLPTLSAPAAVSAPGWRGPCTGTKLSPFITINAGSGARRTNDSRRYAATNNCSSQCVRTDPSTPDTSIRWPFVIPGMCACGLYATAVMRCDPSFASTARTTCSSPGEPPETRTPPAAIALPATTTAANTLTAPTRICIASSYTAGTAQQVTPSTCGGQVLPVSGAAPESNRPSRGLHGLTGFEDQLGHQPLPLRGEPSAA